MKPCLLISLTLFVLISVSSVRLPSLTGSSAVKDDITKELITSRGKTRAYYLYVPTTIAAGSKAPLIVTLHGSGRNGITLVEKWKDYAKKEGIILAGPDASNSQGWAAPQDGPDFLRDLIEELKTKYPVNPRRVYLFGHSAGACFAIHMSLMESKYFAATAIHAGALRSDREFELVKLPKRKIPISIQVGDSDAFFPLKEVRATKDALLEAGFPVELIEIKNHDHWYYDSASKFNQTAWEFLKKYELAEDPQYDQYDWN
jgi:predicted esterase